MSIRRPSPAAKRLLDLWLSGRTHPPSQQRLAEFEAFVADVEREAVDPYARLVVDPYDIDQALYLNDPIYKGIAYRLHRGTPKSRPVHETGDPRPYGSDRDDPEW